jgi:hypothetical protein
VGADLELDGEARADASGSFEAVRADDQPITAAARRDPGGLARIGAAARPSARARSQAVGF